MTSYWLQSENKIFCRVFFSSEGGHLSRDAMRNTRDLSTIVLSFYLDSIRQDEFDQVFVLDFDENRLNKKQNSGPGKYSSFVLKFMLVKL